MGFNLKLSLCRSCISVIATLVLIVSFVFSQSASIHSLNGTPREGEPFTLICQIVYAGDFDYGILWVKDSENIGWYQNANTINLDETGSYCFHIRSGNIAYILYLQIAEFSTKNYGKYTCILAEGTYDNFVIIRQDSEFFVDSNGIAQTTPTTIQPSATTKSTLPSSESPMCFPDNDLHALIYTNVTLTCTSGINLADATQEMDIYASFNPLHSLITKNGNERNATYTITARPENQNTAHKCRIVRSVTGGHSCQFGILQIELFQEHVTYAAEGDNTIFDCIAGLHTEIDWSSDPPIQSNRLTTAEPNLLQINNVELSDNGTQVTCRVLNQPIGKELEDTAILIVTPSPTPITITSETAPLHNYGHSVPLLTGVGFGSFILGIFLTLLFVFICHWKVKCRQPEDRDIKPDPQSQTGRTNAAITIDRNEDSYMGLNPSEMQDSNYTCLKTNQSLSGDAPEMSRDFINMRTRNEDPMYESTLP